MSEQGRKYDGGKLRYDLLPVLALEEMVKGLTFGTIKYDDNNWVKVPNGRKRYMSAALRHIQEYRKGSMWDEEQNIHHLSAAMNNLSFIAEKDLRGWEDISDEQSEDTNEVSDTNSLWYPPVEDGGNPWIEYGGYVQPVSDEVVVEVMCRYEREQENWSPAPACTRVWGWTSSGGTEDIVAYRVVG